MKTIKITLEFEYTDRDMSINEAGRELAMMLEQLGKGDDESDNAFLPWLKSTRIETQPQI